jgi:hypothetical protein
MERSKMIGTNKSVGIPSIWTASIDSREAILLIRHQLTSGF